jgi:hypothetical protein
LAGSLQAGLGKRTRNSLAIANEPSNPDDTQWPADQGFAPGYSVLLGTVGCAGESADCCCCWTCCCCVCWCGATLGGSTNVAVDCSRAAASMSSWSANRVSRAMSSSANSVCANRLARRATSLFSRASVVLLDMADPCLASTTGTPARRLRMRGWRRSRRVLQTNHAHISQFAPRISGRAHDSGSNDAGE